MSKLRNFLKPKHKEEKRHLPLSYWIVIVLIGVLLLNFVFLFPPQLSALFFESELWLIQFLRMPVITQMWEFIFYSLIIAWIGWYIMPVIEIPWTNESHFYTRRSVQNGVVFFTMLNGMKIAVSMDVLKKRVKRWMVIAPVDRNIQGDIIVYETKNLEITTSLQWMRYAASLAEVLSKLYAAMERKELNIPKGDAIDLIKAMRGGEEK